MAVTAIGNDDVYRFRLGWLPEDGTQHQRGSYNNGRSHDKIMEPSAKGPGPILGRSGTVRNGSGISGMPRLDCVREGSWHDNVRRDLRRQFCGTRHRAKVRDRKGASPENAEPVGSRGKDNKTVNVQEGTRDQEPRRHTNEVCASGTAQEAFSNIGHSSSWRSSRCRTGAVHDDDGGSQRVGRTTEHFGTKGQTGKVRNKSAIEVNTLSKPRAEV